jgi:hypothetical protein
MRPTMRNCTGDFRYESLHRRHEDEEKSDKEKQSMNQDAEPDEDRAQTEQLM